MLRFSSIALGVIGIACATGSGQDEDFDTQTDELKNGTVPAYGVHGIEYYRVGSPEGDAILDQQLKASGDNHVRIVRTVGFATYDASWDGPTPPSLAGSDAFMLLAAKKRITVIPVLFSGVPNVWEHLDGWAKFTRALVARYGPIGHYITPDGQVAGRGTFWLEHPELTPTPIRAWEIWNEPNLSVFWANPDPVKYRMVLERSKRELRAVDASARVILGGISFVGETITNEKHRAEAKKDPQKRAQYVLGFLNPILANGGKCLFDAVAIHPYAETASGAFALVKGTRDKLDANGLKDTGIWITEVGWAVATKVWPHPDAGFTVESDGDRKARIAAFSQLVEEHRDAWKIGPTIWYTIRNFDEPKPDPKDEWVSHSGFFNADFTHSGKAWREVGKIAHQHPSAPLPPVRLCAWEQSKSHPEDRCGCTAKCAGGDQFLPSNTSNSPTGCEQVSRIYCNEKYKGYDFVPCKS